MDDSILKLVKKAIGIFEDDYPFEQELIMHINTAIDVIAQLGFRSEPYERFKVTSINDTWDEYLQGRDDLEDIKQIIYLRVRLSFDPPHTSYLITNLKEQREELEWRLEVKLSEE